MPVYFRNCRIDIATTSRDSTTGKTSGTFTPSQTGVDAHIQRLGQEDWQYVPPDEVPVRWYKVRVASGTDLAKGDKVTAIWELDGKTRWPYRQTLDEDIPVNEGWNVHIVLESEPGPWNERTALIYQRITGPAGRIVR